MALPLQPALRPAPPWFKRGVMLAALACAVLALGLVSSARTRPPQLLLSHPGHEEEYVRAVERLLAGAHQRIWVWMFVVRVDGDGPVLAIMQALADAAARGVHVQVGLDRGRDWETKEPDTKHVAAENWLRDHGVRVVLDELDRTSHAKVVLVDRHSAVVGSHNWTRSALVANREASLVVEDAEVATGLERLFLSVPGWDPDY